MRTLALKMAHRAVPDEASGVDMGRNIFQSDAPMAMIHSVRAIVHDSLEPDQALDLHQTIQHPLASQQAG